ncbi:TPA: aldehyde ferredoxin oxidoreductase, partial [Candidatus Bathyarchaeota archaeon]|nr:aldehyde ferredoxin oxidoreductase [Candidatus Bathyarchaeota archaeon]
MSSGFDYGGYMGKILRVDLSQKEVKEEPLEKGFVEKFIGGKGFGAWLLYRELKAGVDPLSPENKLVIATGPLTGTAALGYSAKYVITTKSPLTEYFYDSYCGGFFGPRLKFAGFDMIVVEGRADKPVYLWVHDGTAEIKDASHLWGKTTHETERMIKEEVGDGKTSVACIGPAGERKVRFACVTNDFGRQAGRGGSGAVFGSKNLKAIAVRGDKKITITKTEEFEIAVKELREIIETSPTTGKDEALQKFGTPAFVLYAQLTGGWPVRNWQRGFFERADGIDADAVNKIVVRHTACFGCIIGCGRMVEVKSGPYEGTRVEGPEYETLGALGANCEIGNVEAVAYAHLLCDEYGMDGITTGMTIGFAMDLYERGIISKEDTGGIDLKFGSEEALIAMIKKIGNREGFGDVLAEGVKKAAEKIGRNADYYAPVVKGLELPAWDPRAFWGYALSCAISHRDPHLSDFTLGRELAGIPDKLDRWTIEGKARIVGLTEEHVAANDTLIHCIFYMFA